jgi:hypothetical protein
VSSAFNRAQGLPDVHTVYGVAEKRMRRTVCRATNACLGDALRLPSSNDAALLLVALRCASRKATSAFHRGVWDESIVLVR